MLLHIACYFVIVCIVSSNGQLNFDSKTVSDSRRSNFQQPGYLPPQEPAPAQVDPVIVSTTQKPGPTHHGRDLCTDPFHSFLCQKVRPRKPITGANNLLIGANSFNAPSKVLAPPVNDLYQFVETTTRQPTTKAKITTTITKTTTTTTTTTTKRPTTTEKAITFAASNRLDNAYLPPDNIAPAAAAPDPAILKLIKPEEDHHHHHHRDICSDPFHSFLCVKLKPRKRITGNLPNSIDVASTNIRPKTIKPEPEISVAPSNDLLRAYLPPSTTTTTTTTTRRPTTTTTTTRRPTRPPPEVPQPSSNEINRAYFTTTTRKPDRAYLPPDQSLSGAAAQDDPVILPPTHEEHHHHHRDICSDPFHSFLCVAPKMRVRITGDLPKNASPQASQFQKIRENEIRGAAASAFFAIAKPPSTTKKPIYVPPSTTTTTTTTKTNLKVPLPSEINEIGYNYPKPIVRLPEPTKGYSYPKPDNKLTLPTENKEVIGYSYPKPTVSLPEPTKGYSYPKPEVKLTLPSENQGYSYPKPSETQGYNYPKPSSTTQNTQENTKLKQLQPNVNLITSDKKANKGSDLKVETIHNLSSQSVSADFIPVNKPVFGQRLKRRNRLLIPPPNSYKL